SHHSHHDPVQDHVQVAENAARIPQSRPPSRPGRDGPKERRMTRTPLTTSLDGYEVWFLTGSQHLYGPETLAQVAEQSRAISGALDAASEVPVRIVWKPVLTDSAAIRRIALEANADDRVIGLIAWLHTFSPVKMWIAGLDALQKP